VISYFEWKHELRKIKVFQNMSVGTVLCPCPFCSLCAFRHATHVDARPNFLRPCNLEMPSQVRKQLRNCVATLVAIRIKVAWERVACNVRYVHVKPALHETVHLGYSRWLAFTGAVRWGAKCTVSVNPSNNREPIYNSEDALEETKFTVFEGSVH
jgi:hypothetical protein